MAKTEEAARRVAVVEAGMEVQANIHHLRQALKQYDHVLERIQLEIDPQIRAMHVAMGETA